MKNKFFNMKNILKQMGFAVAGFLGLLLAVFVFFIVTRWMEQIDESGILRAVLLVLGMIIAGWYCGSGKKGGVCEASRQAWVRQNWWVGFLWTMICLGMIFDLFQISERFYSAGKSIFGDPFAAILRGTFGSVSGLSILCFGMMYVLGRIYHQKP